MIKSAYLRVYTEEAPASSEPVPGFVSLYGMLGEAEPDHVVEWEGRRLICPSNLRLRVLESTVAFANAFRGIGSGLIPEEAASAADQELRAYLRSHPDHRSHVLTSAWHVPVRWFSAFEPSERQLYEGPNGMRLRYRTSMTKARSRTADALEILERLGVFQAPAEELAHLSDWLGQFSEDSMVELDYGAVAELFDPDEILFDDSCELIRHSLQALADGDMLTAGENYGRVVSRWAHAYSLSFTS